jgi:hypothetical protein
MTESERKHLRRMVRHAEKVRRNMENLRKTNLTPEELAEAIKEAKRKYPNEFP